MRTYGCAVHTHRLKIASFVRHIEQMHRSMLLCYEKLYCTVLYMPTTIITNWVPAKYELASNAVVFSVKNKMNLMGLLIMKMPSDTDNLWTDMGNEVCEK